MILLIKGQRKNIYELYVNKEKSFDWYIMKWRIIYIYFWTYIKWDIESAIKYKNLLFIIYYKYFINKGKLLNYFCKFNITSFIFIIYLTKF